MKILFIITGLGMGGAERQVCDLADHMAASGHQVSIISLTGDANIRPQNCNIHIHALNMKKTIFGLYKSYKQSINFIKSYQPDIIHAHMFHANIFARMLKLSFKRIPNICTAHNTNEGGHLRMKLYKVTHHLCNMATNVSQEAVNAFEEKKAVPKQQMQLVYNGINDKKFTASIEKRNHYRTTFNIQPTQKVLISIGRMEPQKDYPNLIHAFKKSLQSNPELKLWIIGEGSQRLSIEQLIANLNLSGHIELLGLQTDIPGLLSAADLFILSSAYEGFGLVVAEAMLTEVIAVATNCGGVSEVMGQYGFLCPPQDAEALSNNINLALNLTNEVASDLKHKARQHVIENFSLNKITAKWLNIYQQLINNPEKL